MKNFAMMFVVFFLAVSTAMAQSAASTAVWVARDAGWIGADVYRTKKSAEIEKKRIEADVAIQGGWQNVEHHRIDAYERVETVRVGAELERARLEAATRAAESAANTARSSCGHAGGTSSCGTVEAPKRGTFTRIPR